MKRFPILVDSRYPAGPRSVPWDLVAPHERQALDNHQQTLQRLAERGGLCCSELLAVLEGRAWRRMDLAEAIAGVNVAVAAWEAKDAVKLRAALSAIIDAHDRWARNDLTTEEFQGVIEERRGLAT